MDGSAVRTLKDATAAALRAWEPSGRAGRAPGDSEEPHIAQVYRSAHPIVFADGAQAGQVRPEFARLALQFWQPVLEACRVLDSDPEEVQR